MKLLKYLNIMNKRILSAKSIKILFLLFFLFFPKAANSQLIQPEVVNGNTYTCYFISQLDIFSSDLIFDEKGMMKLTTYPGNGFYFTLTDLFVGVYWSLNQTIGLRRGDFIFIMSGSTRDPFISGVCIMLYEYKEIFFSLFFGFRSVETI